jgi:hypothetical protein
MTQMVIPRNAIPLLAAVAIALAGCATQDAAPNAPRAGGGIAEYRQIVDEARSAMGAALRSLDRVSAQTNHCPPRVLAGFSKELQRLEVESIRLRARSQAMQARGDAYFENWHENLARVTDPKVRELAAQRRPELQRSFANIKRSSEDTRQTFKQFLSGLRKLQTALENDPDAVATDATRDLMRSTRDLGGQVDQGIAAVGAELKAMSAMLTPVKSGTQH